MRFLIVLASIILIPVLVLAHWWIYDEELKPALASRALGELARVGITNGDVKLDNLDVTISGTAHDVEMRQRAASSVRGINGIHFVERNNLIVVPARVDARVDGQQLTLSGWLPDERSVQTVIRVVGEFRPDLTVDARTLRISPFVIASEDGTGDITPKHRLLKPILASLRTPASFAIRKSGGTYFLEGALPSAAAKQAVIEATQDNPGGWTVDTSALIGAPHIQDAVFTKSNALPLFLKSYFSVPTPGTLSFNDDGAPRIVADATREMEAEWLALLRGVSGAAKVDAVLTIYPSVYQLPGYRAESVVADGTLTPVVDALKQTAVHFDAAANVLTPEEEAELVALAPLLVQCGPGLQLVLSGAGGGDAESPATHQARCEVVKARLIALGLSASQMEVLDIGALHPQAPVQVDPAKESGARVEMLVK